ncbi:UDP-glucose 4-epimerase [Rhodococcus kronopolitis]|uniref:UDP-glucose 4-epimerase n=1 Tax=Rhodococcus kronopolitis TaxID=1460226 RepID=A0ABV9FQ21_9NOCA
MAGQLEVDPDALRALAAALSAEADEIECADASGPVAAAADAMTGSAVGGAADRARLPLWTALRGAADRLREMSVVAKENADDYAAAERRFRRQLGAEER